MLMKIANWQLKHCNIQICPESVSKFVYDKVAVFSLSKFKHVNDSLHSCTDGQNIQSHWFNSLVPGPSRNYCFKTPQNEILISANLWVLSVPNQVNAR